ncbi:hypothetical protein EI94DRAFT_1703533 [Lactarius quietus]|nr:hypothetical protein EI94DRAFT_1703533 [Lactarius quietus]
MYGIGVTHIEFISAWRWVKTLQLGPQEDLAESGGVEINIPLIAPNLEPTVTQLQGNLEGAADATINIASKGKRWQRAFSGGVRTIITRSAAKGKAVRQGEATSRAIPREIVGGNENVMDGLANNPHSKKARSRDARQVKSRRKETNKTVSWKDDCEPIEENANETVQDELFEENSNKTGEGRNEEAIICVKTMVRTLT